MVDIETYRARIGCFSVGSGSVLDLETLRVVGVPGFVGILLFMAGVELNPGPFQVDELSMALLPDEWSASHVARKSTGNGNCLFNSCSLALCGDETLATTLRSAVAHELQNNASAYGPDHTYIQAFAKQQNMSQSEILILYQTVLSTTSDAPLSLTLENIAGYIRAEGTKTFDDMRWSTILHVMALSTVIGKEIRSVYPDTPWNYRGLYNNSVFPVAQKSFTFPPHSEQLSTEIVIFWTRDGNLSQTDYMFVANHIVPLLRKESDTHVVSDIEIIPVPSKKRKTQQKMDSFFTKPGPSTNSHTVNTHTEPPPIQVLPNEVISHDTSSLTSGICPDLATLVQRRTQLSDEEKFHILSFSVHRLSKYPTTKQRKYNSSWETQFSWLRYSVSEDGAYCGPCFVFGQTDVRNKEFTSTPFKDWKNAVGAKRGILPSHNCSQIHIAAVKASVLFLKVCKGSMESINESLSTAYSDKIKDNRHALMAIINVIIKLSSRGIPLRGKWSKDHKREDSNFNYFMDWISTYDEKLSKHLIKSPQNAKYTSPQFQNEIIKCIGDYIRSKIVTDVSKSSFFSIMADETTDVSVTEQMSVCVRYIVDKDIREDFIGFVELPKTNAETITTSLIEHLQKWQLDLTKWRGKGFDGASTMSGHINGVQARITRLFPQAKYFTHCKSHCLNLVVVSSCSKVPQIRNFMNTFQELTFFFHNSAKRKTILSRYMSAKCSVSDLLADSIESECENENEILQFASKRQSLPTLSDTRWLSRVDSISTLLVHYEHIYEALGDIMDESSGQSVSDASSYLRSMESFEFIIVACLTQYVLAFIRPLSVNLQAKDCDLLRAHTEANTLVDILKTIRSDSESFEKIYNRSVTIAARIHIEPGKPRIVGRQKHRANAGENTSVLDYFKINHFYPFLDHVIQHLTSRFPEQLEDVLKGTYLLPGQHEHLTDTVENQIKQTFLNDLPIASQFESELIRWRHTYQHIKNPMSLQEGFGQCNKTYFPNVNAIFEMILSLPVGSCSCERSFSALRRLKTWTRSTMKDQRLNGIALMYVHKSIPIDIKDILQLWDAPGHRRIALAFDKDSIKE